ncbi:MAG: BMP family ABC transporter substrate-binding protein [Anaerolineales bacterium]
MDTYSHRSNLKRILLPVTWLAVFSIFLAGCGLFAPIELVSTFEVPLSYVPTWTPTPFKDVEPTNTPLPTTVEKKLEGPTVLVCYIQGQYESGDDPIIQSGWDGLTQAEAELPVKIEWYDSIEAQENAVIIEDAISDGCELIITMGADLIVAFEEAAGQNPEQHFAIIEYSSYDPLPNLMGVIFDISEAAFLSGYVAAGTSQTGVVGTFGGMDIPYVTDAMDAFYYGVDYYNQQHETNVQVLGRDPEAGTGSFVGNFISLEDGEAYAKDFVEQDADIILPIAASIARGAAVHCMETQACWVIGFDYDRNSDETDLSDIWLTSIERRLGVGMYYAVEQYVTGNFSGGNVFLDLAEGAVGLALFYDFEEIVPEDVIDALPDLIDGIIAGEIQVIP